MIEAVINGLKPTSIIEKLVRAPPVNKLINPPKSVLFIADSTTSFKFPALARGIGTWAKNLKITKRPITPKTRFCISLFFIDLTIVFQFITNILPHFPSYLK